MRTFSWVTAAVTIAAITTSAGAQSGNQSDVTGVSTTGSTIAGGAFAPGPVAVPVSPQVQAAITQASGRMVAQLVNGTLTSPAGVPLAIPAATQRAVVALMTRWTAEGGSGAAVVADLAAAGAPYASVTALVESLAGLLTSPAPGQLASAISNFNALVGTVDASFLVSPPPSFVAIQAVLANLVAAGRAAGGAPIGR